MATPDVPFPPGSDPDVAAAELALGLLDGDDRAAALRRQLSDPDFARDVERWRTHFGTLFDGVHERPVPAHLAERIEARLDGPSTPAVAVRSPGYWRPLALASSALAASLGGFLLVTPQSAPSPVVVAQAAPAQMIAALAHAGPGAPLPAYYDSAQHMVRMPAPMPIPAGRSAQLWATVDGGPPIPLGLFHIVGKTVVADAKGMSKMTSGTMLAISFEPMGGSPTGKPTGPVVASGALSRV